MIGGKSVVIEEDEEEEEEGVARVTAKVRYGKVVVGLSAAILVWFTLSLILVRTIVTPHPSIRILAMASLLNLTS